MSSVLSFQSEWLLLADLLLTDSLTFCLSRNLIFSFIWGIVLPYADFQVDKLFCFFFSFSTLKMSYQFFLAFILLMKNRLLIILRISHYWWVASLLLLSKFFVIIFSQFHNVSQNDNLFWVYSTWILWASSCVHLCLSSTLGNFGHCFFTYSFCDFLSLLSLWDSHVYFCIFFMVSHRLLSLFFLFLFVFEKKTNVYWYTNVGG